MSKVERKLHKEFVPRNRHKFDGWDLFIASLVHPSHQEEVYLMGKSIADLIKEDAVLKRSRDFFLLLLRAKFKTVPESIVAEVQAATDIHQFDAWGIALLKARRITDIPFKTRS
jgi:hypothetical protein